MGKYVIAIAALLLGALLGGMAVWVDTYRDEEFQPEVVDAMTRMIKYSAVAIAPDNYRCEGDAKDTVGAVVGAIIAENLSSKRNRMSFSCGNNVCTLSVSSCNPWSMECGARYLKYDLNEVGEIDSLSFSCFDLP